MSKTISELVASVADEDRADLAAKLDPLFPVGIGNFSVVALGFMKQRPRMALHMYMWLIDKRETPDSPSEREEWLKAHNNATYLAALHGNPEECLAVADLALLVAPENIAIYHNVACLLCKVGDPEGALDAIRVGIARGYDEVVIDSIRNDADLDLIRHTDEFLAVLKGRGGPVLPTWADGWTSAEFSQFREAIRTTLPHCDMSQFEEGSVESEGKTFAILELAAKCRGLDASTCAVVVHRYLHAEWDK